MSLIRMIPVAAMTVALVSQPAAAQDGRVLAPSSHWEMNYDDDSCVLRRGFGGEGEGVFFELRQFAPGLSYQMLLVSPDLAVGDESPTIRYGSDGDSWKPRDAVIVEYEGGLEGVLLSDTMLSTATKSELRDLDEDERTLRYRALTADMAALSERETIVETITVGDVFGEDVTLRTGSMKPPMDAMRECTGEMERRWGFDPAVQQTLSRHATPRNGHRLARRVQQVYPRAMRNTNQSARLRIRLDIDEQGSVTGCHFQLPVEQEAFREDACNSLMPAQFEPALDADGSPVASYWTTAISYLMSW